MRINKIVFLLLSMVTGLNLAAEQKDWENPYVFGINKLPYHATLGIPSKVYDRSDVISLNGDWKFYWSPDPDNRPLGFESEEYDVSGWNSIA
ncbi:MAG: hypothetical protein K2K32_08640, partial [Muribaculaceae bacterium]|nr:hypothetical protein [Muribaculaceae bacterium]